MERAKDWIKSQAETLAAEMGLQISNLGWHLDGQLPPNDNLCFDAKRKRHCVVFESVELDGCDEGAPDGARYRPLVTRRIKSKMESIRRGVTKKK